MKSKCFETPQRLNMGFHYTLQFSRRTRVCVIGLVDQGSEAWRDWYLRMHEAEAVREIAAAGYTAIEIHFLYGYGLEGEREEWERTRQMVGHAHEAGLKVFGYFQFFSVQQELFFLENPWARDCLQIDAEGRRREYRYDRPALCFSHPQVRQYYLDGLTLGIETCRLDGIRLDNDYFKGCYCSVCQAAFRRWLKKHFDETSVRRVFGLPTTDGMSLAPEGGKRARIEPLFLATALFRQEQRQQMLRALNQRVAALNPEAILGGNPGVPRQVDDATRSHVYVPDLGETHHLVCAENSRFPTRVGDTYQHQVFIYKQGQANDFAVFASHHLHLPDGRVRWPETVEECALSLCEPLAFGGHVACTTWGIRMDGENVLYQRPVFRRAMDPIASFLDRFGDWYRGAACDAGIGIYHNRECACLEAENGWRSLHGAIQTLLQHHIPFRLAGRDDDRALSGLDLVLVPDMRFVSDAQVERFSQFVQRGGKLLVTGESFAFDEWGLRRRDGALDRFWERPGVHRVEGTPEKIAFDSEEEFQTWSQEATGSRHPRTPLPPGHEELAAQLRALQADPGVRIEGNPFIAIDTFRNGDGERFVHVINYDNAHPADVCVRLPADAADITCAAPEGLGYTGDPSILKDGDGAAVSISRLHTYAVIRWKQ